jgi:hypothetical protein
MSVFTVKLNNSTQGGLDMNPQSLGQFTTSVQRTIFVTGPKRIYRKLFDGETFTDCNYWKKFAVPNLPADQAFIEVTTDDGSIYSEVDEENNYPKVYSLTVDDGSDFVDNVCDIVGDTGSTANFVQINSTNSSGGDVRVKLNGMAGAIFDLKAGDTQVFNYGDLAVTKLAFDNSSGTDAEIQVIVSVKSSCLS